MSARDEGIDVRGLAADSGVVVEQDDVKRLEAELDALVRALGDIAAYAYFDGRDAGENTNEFKALQ